MRGIIRKTEREALGSASCRVERGDARKRSKRTRQGEHMQTYDKRTGLEENGHWTRDQAGVTEHTVGAGGQVGYVTPSATSRKFGRRVSTGDEVAQGIHTRNGAGYDVWATEVDIWHRGGAAVVWRATKGWQVEGMDSFFPNVLSFLIMSGTRQW